MQETKVVLVYWPDSNNGEHDAIFTKNEQEWFLRAPHQDIKHFNKGDELYFSHKDMNVGLSVEKKYFSSDDPECMFIQVTLDTALMSPKEFWVYIRENWSREIPKDL
ncbi:MAG: hypothetical protein HGA67_04585 [Candidatus Yonathbacteria bacterium]|nr:hypothetical protein [Candidatus Yonathbacteria bacterium]